jgi:hypothetical protein
MHGIAVNACSCLTPQKIKADDLKSNPTVFTGRVIRLEKKEDSYEVIATFEVKEYLFGIQQLSTYQVTTSADGGMCGLDFAIGEEWYVFAMNIDGQLHAGLCSRSVQLTKRFYPKFELDAKTKRQMRRSNQQQLRRVEDDKRFIRAYLKRH